MYMLVARADFDLLVALLALHEAAPLELAVTPFDAALKAGRVAAIAAHHVATVGAVACLQRNNKKFTIKSSVFIKST